MVKTITIEGRQIGESYPCYIIAEAGVNHNGDINIAKQLIAAAKDVGADAVKFQTWKTENVITRYAPKAAYQKDTTDASESQFDMLEKLALSYDDFAKLKAYCDEVGITFLSTAADEPDVEILHNMGMAAFKVPSMDVVNFPKLKYMAGFGKPVILSTGMATMGEIESAINILEVGGCTDIVLLQCTTSYPTRPEDVNLRAMLTLKTTFGYPVGFSDHTTGTVIAASAVAMGAVVVEKHFTLDQSMIGPDHRASLNPQQFQEMIDNIRLTETALGDWRKQPTAIENQNRSTMRRSMVARYDLKAGTVLDESHLILKRPGDGLGAEFIPHFVGHTLKNNLAADQQFKLTDIE